MVNNFQLISAAWMMGILGGAHCISMCGGIISGLCYACPQQAKRGWSMFFYQLWYSLGRITTYTLLGAITGLAGTMISRRIGAYGGDALRFAASLMIVMTGFYIAGWWRAITSLERLGVWIWRPASQLTRYFYPVKNFKFAFMLGGLWGLLPCGLIYTALLVSLGTGSAITGAAVMLFFGLGTMPALLLVGSAMQSYQVILSQQWVRQLSGVTMMIFGMMPFLMMLMHHGPSGCPHC